MFPAIAITPLICIIISFSLVIGLIAFLLLGGLSSKKTEMPVYKQLHKNKTVKNG